MKLKQKREMLEKLTREIKTEERKIEVDRLAKELKKNRIGNCYKFRNSWNSKTGYWFMYKEVVDVKLVDNSVYMIVNSYEKRTDGVVIIKLNDFDLQNDSWDRGWDSIKKEEFLENKNLIIKEL